MNVPIRQRLVVTLLLLFVSSIMGSLTFKAYAAIFYIIAFILIISALILAVGQVNIQQRKTALILIPIVIMLGGIGTYFLLGLLHR